MKKKIFTLLVPVLVAFFSVISIYAYEETTDNELILQKSVTQQADDNGNYKITLDAYTTGEVKAQTVPVDVIFVLDTSSTMNYKFKSGEGKGELKIDCLKRSVKAFITKLNDNARENDIVHRVEIITFDSGAEEVTEGGYVEIDGSDSVDTLIGLVDGITAYGGTNPDEGMVLAEKIFDENTKKDINSQAVIMFTDDCPQMSGYVTDVPDKAIRIAKRLKDQGVTSYSVGVFNGANPDMITYNDSNITEALYLKNIDVIANRFLNYFSSNSPDANDLDMELYLKENEDGQKTIPYIKIDDPIYEWSNKGYYMTAEEADELASVFDDISQELVTPSVSLDEQTQVRDYISKYFKLPDDFIPENITLKAIPYGGGNTWGTPVAFSYTTTGADGTARYESTETDYDLSVKYENDSVIVDGFNYNDHVVGIDSSGNPTGSKLQISFDITRQNHFIGGNNVPTNTKKSGVYLKEKLVEKFVIPTTQVDLIYDFEIENQIIYRGNKVEVEKLFHINTTDFGVANKYVNIYFYIYDSKDQEIGTVTIPSGASDIAKSLTDIMELEDSIYKIVCNVIPTTTDEECVEDLEITKHPLVYVLQPDVLVRNLWVDYGTTVDIQKHAIEDIIWRGNKPEETYHSRKDDPPTVTIIYDDLEAKEVVVMRNLQYLIDKLNIVSWDGKDESQMNIDRKFNIHLNEYSIAITKVVTKEDYQNNAQSFLFEIDQNGNVMELIMPSDAFEEFDDETLSCTMNVSGLYAGLDSKVLEKTLWSWRYELDNCDEEVMVAYHNTNKISYTKVDAGATFASFKNKQTIQNWLSDEQTVINKFAKDREVSCE